MQIDGFKLLLEMKLIKPCFGDLMKWVATWKNTDKSYSSLIRRQEHEDKLWFALHSNYRKKNKEESIKVIKEFPTNTDLVWILHYNWPNIHKIWSL